MSEPKTTSVIPRYRMRPKFKNLHVNEHAWASNFSVKVLDDGSVYLDVEDDIRHFAGSQPWPEHNKYGDVLIERVEDGYVLHIFDKDLFVPTVSDVEGEQYVQITKIVDHGPGWKECKACQGRGIVEVEDAKM